MRMQNDIDSQIQAALADAKAGRLSEAEGKLRDVLRLEPSFAPVHYNLGVALAEQGKTVEAIESFGCAIQLRADYVAAHLSLASALSAAGRKPEAVGHYRRALELQPDLCEALNGLGLTMTELGRPGEATVCLEASDTTSPRHGRAHNNLGLALVELARYAEAEAAYEHALRLDPRYVEAHTNLGTALSQQGRFQEALACYQVALWLAPNAVSTHWNRSLAWLTQGNYEQGWPEYEWRWRRKKSPMRPFTQPTWDGSDLAGRSILLWSEQGLGDTIQFIRYAAMVKQKGAKIIAQVPSPLQLILAGCPGIDVLRSEGEDLPELDVQVALMSLPYRCGTRLSTVPSQVPYLHADPALIERWRSELKNIGGMRIGIAWQGNPHHQWDRHRSVPLKLFESLARIPGVQLHSLQRGPGTEQAKAMGGRFALRTFEEIVKAPSDARAWADIAAIMTNLDLVISVDTATAHLAGALGVKTWTILSDICDWRWMRDRGDTPWYPAMRLFRQRNLGEWSPVFEEMALALGKLTNKSQFIVSSSG